MIVKLRRTRLADLHIARQLGISARTVRIIAGRRTPTPIDLDVKLPCTPCISCGRATFVDVNPYVRGRYGQCVATKGSRSIASSQPKPRQAKRSGAA